MEEGPPPARWAICVIIRRSRRPLLSLVTLVAPSSRAGGRHVKSSHRVRVPRCTWTLRGGLWGRWVGHEHRWWGSGRWGWNGLLWPPCALPGSVDSALPPARFRIHVAWQRSSLAAVVVDGLGEATSFERPVPVPVAALPLPACRGGRCPGWAVHIAAHSTSPQPAAAVPWREAGCVVDSTDSRADVFKRRERTERGGIPPHRPQLEKSLSTVKDIAGSLPEPRKRLPPARSDGLADLAS